jgi:uncharacterized protein YggE
MKPMVRIYLLLAAVCLPAVSTTAQPIVDKAAHPYVRATGSATASAKPDRARLTIGVVTQAATAEAAASRNAERADTLMAALHRSLGPGAQIQTSGYSLTPDFRQPRDGGQQTLTGYTASNNVEIVTDDLGNLGKLIDASTLAGGNNVQGLEFSLKDDKAARAQALGEAARKARASADAVAAALGLRVVRVLSAEEGEPEVIRPMMAMAMAPSARATPIEAGNIQVQATVTVTVEVGQPASE